MKKLAKFITPLLMIGVIAPINAATLKWSMPGDSLTLDPHAQNEGPTHMVSRQVYESLVTRTLDMSIQPQLATSWKTSDPETWVFTLRNGVKFEDGSSLSASDVLSDTEGVIIIDHRVDEGYITPKEAAGEDGVYLSRIRVDNSVPSGLVFWCVSDNLRKGAALNAVQIAELAVSQGLK